MANKIELEISAGTDLLVKGLKDGDRAVVKFTDTVNKNFNGVKKSALDAGSSIANAFKSSFTDLAKGVAVGNLVASAIQNAASAIKSFVGGSIDAAQKQEDAINKLSQALRSSGEFTKGAVKDFEAYASQIQKVSKFGDEVVLSQLAIAKSFEATNDQAKNLIQAAINLEGTFGGSLEERVQQLGQTLTGTAGRLGRIIPEFQNLTKEQLRSGDALDIINQKFAGAGQAQLDTYSGRVKSLSNALGDLQEEIGFAITKSSSWNSVIKFTKQTIEGITSSIQKNTVIQTAQNNGFVDTQQELDVLSERYAQVRDEIEKYQAVIDADKNKTLLQSLFSFDNAPLAKEKIRDLRIEFNELTNQFERSVSAINEQEQKASSGRSPLAVDPEVITERQKFIELAKQQQAEFQAFEIQSRLDLDEFTTEQRRVEFDNLLQFELDKIEAIRQAEIAKTELIQDSQAKRLAQEQINQKAQLAAQKTTITRNIAEDKAFTAAQRKEQEARLSIANNFLNAGLALSKQGSEAQKALAITQSVINTYQAATNALADTRPASLAPFAAASIVALGLANVARIRGAKFAQGGIVGGTSFSGDRVPARVNSGEMILNRSQQARLFEIANNGQSESSNRLINEIRSLASAIKDAPIVVEANGREIARLVRDEDRNGFGVLA
jgi:hypothetical protein